ncbi:hypothetical protein [Bosea sp. RAC05]|uniref:hypothetical protein n=1 Tax=Bosea sp. RAC05 TaxID=1842539 RepID=UPI00083D0AF3|nr:hypothetical protein [Bosea sp. RAC05]AOG05446.1 hypothetical protein BSY19_176 [Bosea sp. RAC05]
MNEIRNVAAETSATVRDWKKPRAIPSTFSTACQAIYTAMPKNLRTYISPLFQYASDRGIDPAQIDDQAIEQFRNQLAVWGVQDPAPFISCLVRDWNVIRTMEGCSHLLELTPPVGKRAASRASRAEAFSARFVEELDQEFGTASPRESDDAHNRYNARKRIERVAETMIKHGHMVGSIADLADKAALKSAIDELYPDILRTKARDLVLLGIERALAKSGQAASLAKVVRAVRYRHQQAGIDLPANTKRQVSHFTMETVFAIFDAAVLEMEQALAGKPNYDALARARACIAVGLVLWNLCPRGTIEGATFSGDHTGIRHRLMGPQNSSSVDLERDLPKEMGASIDRYVLAVTQYLGRTPSALLDSGRDEPVSGSALSTGVRRFLTSIGHDDLTLQRLRDGANAAYLKANPKMAEWLSDANGFRYTANFKVRFRALMGINDAQRLEDTFEASDDREGARL